MPPTLGPPDQRYVDIFELIFSNTAAAHAYGIFAEKDVMGQSYTRDVAINLWRAWRNAKTEFENSRPLAAFEILQASTKRFPYKTDSDEIAEAERLVLLAECFVAGNQMIPAVGYTLSARDVLRGFIHKIGVDPASCTEELRKMLGVLVSVEFKHHDRGDGLITAWLATRGVRLACVLAQQRAQLPIPVGSDVAQPAFDLEDDVRLIEESTGLELKGSLRASIDFALGDIFTATDPQRAFKHFDAVANRLGVEHGLGLQAAVNAANCLLRVGRFAEAEGRYASLEGLFEMRGNRPAAARVWMSECIANWKRLRDPKVIHSLVGAIKMFEESIPRGADVTTLYTQKRLAEPAYMALIAAIVKSNDRSEATLNQLLSVAWAMFTRDLLSNLEPPETDDYWENILTRVRQPLTSLKVSLERVPGLGILHLVSGPDSLVWIAFGYDREKKFRFECHSFEKEGSDLMIQFLTTMSDQLEADKIDDRLGIARLEKKLEKLGQAISAQLSEELLEFMAGMHTLFYMPHPFGNLDEFPLAGLRLKDSWLGEKVAVIRSPSVTHLRETLSPNRAEVLPNRQGVVVLGAPDAAGQVLRGAQAEADRVRQILQIFDFEAEVYPTAGRDNMTDWLDGAAGTLHYVGHGMADEIYEGLPLPNGQMFGPTDADGLDGFRVPFVFLCACMAGRVRGGEGGYQIGVASKLVERGGPGVVAFSMPVTESAAYSLTESFYRAASQQPFAEATRKTFTNSSKTVPLYARLAFTAYGDPHFELRSMSKGESVPILAHTCQSWHSKLRRYCVLRTPESAEELRKAIPSSPTAAQKFLSSWLEIAFQNPASTDTEVLDALEKNKSIKTECSDVELISMRVAVAAELLHRSGIETVPIYIADGESIRTLLNLANFTARVGAFLFDAALNGVGNSLTGRVITVDQNDARRAELYLRQGREKLLECEERSPFVKNLRADDLRILKHFGLT